MPEISDINATVIEPDVITLACPQQHVTVTDIDNKCQECGAVLVEVYA